MVEALELLKVFVYGTLKPGEINYQRYCLGQTVAEQPAIAYGQLYSLPAGYPAMTAGTNRVEGFLLTFRAREILADLDRLEDYHPDNPPEDNEYYRQERDIFSKWKEVSPLYGEFSSTLHSEYLGKAWVYLMDVSQAIARGGILIPHGCWTGNAS